MTVVAQCVFDLSRAGAQQVVYHLASLRDREHFRMVIYGFRDGALSQALRAGGEVVRIVPQFVPFFDPSLSLRLAASFRRERIDLVHTHLFGADLHASIAARCFGNLPVVTTIHSDCHDNWRQRLVAGSLLRSVQRIVAVGKRVSDYLVSDWPDLAPKLSIIPNGVQDLPNASALRASARSLLGLDGADLVIGTVGRLSREKAHSNLLLAFRAVADRQPNARLIILGEGPLRPRLESLRSSLGLGGRVDMPGNLPNASHLIPAFDLFVLSSHWEGLPMALLEAMVAGLPCVCTNVGSVREAIRDPETGRLVPPGEPGALALALLDLIGKPEQGLALGQAARQLVIRDYSASAMVASYQKLYLETLTSSAADGRPRSSRLG